MLLFLIRLCTRCSCVLPKIQLQLKFKHDLPLWAELCSSCQREEPMPLVTAEHGIWHESGKGRGNPKIYGVFCFICNPGCWGNKLSPSLYRARESLALIWTRCPDGVRWWTEIVVRVAPSTKTATPNTAVRLEQLCHKPHGYHLFTDSNCVWTKWIPAVWGKQDISNHAPVMSFVIFWPYLLLCSSGKSMFLHMSKLMELQDLASYPI